MIISITGKPCSGKGEVSKIISKKYGFERISTGSIFRKAALNLGYNNINSLSIAQFKEIDEIVDSSLVEIGKARLNDNLILDSRLAWHFVPKSFKVFLDVDWQIAANRLLGANRESEHISSLQEAIESLQHRWNVENSRYHESYNVDNLHKENYDLIINTNDKSPEEVAQIIYREYKKFK